MKLYKVLKQDGTSLFGGLLRIRLPGGRRGVLPEVKYPLPVGGEPGAWVDVGGLGCFCVEEGGALLPPRGSVEIILVEMETDDAPDIETHEYCKMHCRRRVRVLRVVPWDEVRDPSWLHLFAGWGGLPAEVQWDMVSKIPITCHGLIVDCAYVVPGLSVEQRRELIRRVDPKLLERKETTLLLGMREEHRIALRNRYFTWEAAFHTIEEERARIPKETEDQHG